MSRVQLFQRSWLLLLAWFNPSHRFDKPFISFIHIDRLELLWTLASLMCVTGWHYLGDFRRVCCSAVSSAAARWSIAGLEIALLLDSSDSAK